MIAENRDPAFWRGIAEDPDVRGLLGTTTDLDALVEHPACIPLASENGGWLFCRVDGLGRVYELHALYRLAGRGKEASSALKTGLASILPDISLVTQSQNPNSRPPLSFGFRLAGDWFDTFLGPCRTWVLTRSAWEASPVRRRM